MSDLEEVKSVQPVKSVESITVKQYQQLLDAFINKSNNILLYAQLLHWSTYNYSVHTTTRELYSKLSENIDVFVEIILGKTDRKVKVKGVKININDINKETFIQIAKDYINFITNDQVINAVENTDIQGPAYQIVGDLNHTIYGFTLK